MATNDDMGRMITSMVLMSFAMIVIPIAVILFIILWLMGLLKPTAPVLSQSLSIPTPKKTPKSNTLELPKEEVLMMCPKCLKITDRSDGTCSSCHSPLVAMDSWADQEDWN